MNQKTAKMLRRLRKGDKKGKREFNNYNLKDRAIIRADYLDRGEKLKKDYSEAKRKVKQERINEQVSYNKTTQE